MISKLERLVAERARISNEIAKELAANPLPLPDWAKFIVQRIPDGDHHMARNYPNRLVLDNAAVGWGCPEYVYGDHVYVAFSSSSGPGLLAVLRALVALEEQRQEERERL